MEVDLKTHEIFINSKCGLISMTQELHVYDTFEGGMLFFYTHSNKITLNKIIGRSKVENMPIVDTKNSESEWKVCNNEELQLALD